MQKARLESADKNIKYVVISIGETIKMLTTINKQKI